MSGNSQGLLQPQIFESLQKKIDEETEVRDVSIAEQNLYNPIVLCTDQCSSLSVKLSKRLRSKVNIFLSDVYIVHTNRNRSIDSGHPLSRTFVKHQ